MGKRLKECREAAGLTLGQVGTYEGVSAQYLSQLETGKRAPGVWPLLGNLARRYRVSTDYLLGLVDDPAGRRDLETEELEALRLWEALDSGQRRLVLDTMKALQKAATPHVVGGEED